MAQEDRPRRGRRPRSRDPGASSSARLGAELRALRTQRGLTLRQLAEQIGFSTAHLSAVELAKSPASEQFVLACDGALNAGGALLALLPAAIYERASRCHRDEARRRWGDGAGAASYRCPRAARPRLWPRRSGPLGRCNWTFPRTRLSLRCSRRAFPGCACRGLRPTSASTGTSCCRVR